MAAGEAAAEVAIIQSVLLIGGRELLWSDL